MDDAVNFLRERVSCMEARISQLEAMNRVEVHIVGDTLKAFVEKGSPVTHVVIRLDNQSVTIKPECYG